MDTTDEEINREVVRMKGLSISGLVLGITATGIGVAAIVLSAIALGKGGKQF